jgi:hypothetical protein
MHTLSTAEDALVDSLVEAVYGQLPATKPYYEIRNTAMLAMAITRCNSAPFEVPDPFQRDRKDEAWQALWNKKLSLYRDFLLKMDSDMADSLALIYRNLDKADLLIDEVARKKS